MDSLTDFAITHIFHRPEYTSPEEDLVHFYNLICIDIRKMDSCTILNGYQLLNLSVDRLLDIHVYDYICI